jgi:hypothetical protein
MVPLMEKAFHHLSLGVCTNRRLDASVHELEIFLSELLVAE